MQRVQLGQEGSSASVVQSCHSDSVLRREELVHGVELELAVELGEVQLRWQVESFEEWVGELSCIMVEVGENQLRQHHPPIQQSLSFSLLGEEEEH